MLKQTPAFALAKDFYQHCKILKLPPHLQSSLLKAAANVALILVEAADTRNDVERARYLIMAIGSLRECQAIFELEEVKDETANRLAGDLNGSLYQLYKAPS